MAAAIGVDEVDSTALNKQDDCLLVLSVFKGSNFVVKERPGYKCKLLARLGDVKDILETGVVDLAPGQTEPNFNAQLAWSLHKKDYLKLRSDGASLKLECHLVKNGHELGDQIGYIVLPVKEAFMMNSIHEVDPHTARAYPLLGTRDPWNNYKPKIKLHFHVEGSTKTKPTTRNLPEKDHKQAVVGTRKSFDTKTGVTKLPKTGAIHSLADPKKLASRVSPKLTAPVVGEIRNVDAEPLATATVQEKKDEFEFHVSDVGYFVLGETSDDDDLYTMMITVVHANHFDLLEPSSTNTENYQWHVEYRSFGYDIHSHMFEITDDNENKRGFIGDKATAKVRANGADFYNFLSKASINFHIYRTKPGSSIPEEVGQTCLSFTELTDPDMDEVKYDLEVVPTAMYPASTNFLNHKPELRITVEVDSMPGFFSTEWQASSPPTPPNVLKDANKNIIEAKTETGVFAKEPAVSARGELNNEQRENGNPDEEADVLFVNKDWEGRKTASASPKDKGKGSRNLEGGDTIGAPTIERPMSQKHFAGDSSIMKAGKYRVTINFEQLLIKCSTPIAEDFTLYFHHTPMGIDEDIECIATPIRSPTKSLENNLRSFFISEGVWNITISLARLSTRLLDKPLVVNIIASSDYAEVKTGTRKPFASCIIPFGQVFFVQEVNGSRCFKHRSRVIHLKRNVHIGYLKVAVRLEMLEALDEVEPVKIAETNKAALPAPTQGTSAQAYGHGQKVRDLRQIRFTEQSGPVAQHDGVDSADGCKYTGSGFARQAVDDFEVWKYEQERAFKEELVQKEKAYLRILSEEWKKRDSDREAQINEKMQELQQKEAEITRDKEMIAQKEEALKRMELEMKSSSQSSTFKIQKQLEAEKLRVRCLQENYKIEVEILQKRIQEYIADVENKTGKILLLETKLKEREDEVAKMVASRNRWSDMEQSRQLDQLKTENQFLKHKLKETEAQREEYKRRIAKMSMELENMKKQKNLNLEAELENLRIQVLASQQRDDIAKERKSLKTVADQIKEIYNFYETKSKTGVESISTPDPKETNYGHNMYERGDTRAGDFGRLQLNIPHGSHQLASRSEIAEEIKRLSDEKAKLLREGKYSKHDLVIRDIDSKLRKLGGLPSTYSY